jgi:hypothetical protein
MPAWIIAGALINAAVVAAAAARPRSVVLV